MELKQERNGNIVRESCGIVYRRYCAKCGVNEMGIRTEYQAVISCDSCLGSWSEASYTQKELITLARKYGWKIGKKFICPTCQKLRK